MTKKNLQSGITLIELLVVIGIIVLISGVLMFNYNSFNNTVSVRNLANDMALAIRQAQTYATSTRYANADGVPFDLNNSAGFGISFALGSAGSQDPFLPNEKKFVLFADFPAESLDQKNIYNKGKHCGAPAPLDECLEVYTISTGDKISDVCFGSVGKPLPVCILDQGQGKKFNLVFRRPIPDANFCSVQSDRCVPTDISYINIYLKSPQGLTKIVQVWNTGQISVID